MNTEVMKISSVSEDIEKIRRAADVIKKGGLVVFPTETVYGLGADATNAEAVKSIFTAKGRPSDNPLIIHIADPRDAEKYTVTNELYYKLAERFMPGPLTVILESKSCIPSVTRASLPTVAVRCPENAIARSLITEAGVPIAAPSANISGTPSPTSAAHVIDDMTDRVDVIIDGGDCDFGLESTIVKIENDGSLTLLRPGKITVDDLCAVAEKVSIADAVLDKIAKDAPVLSPGMKYRHYAPSAPLELIDGDPKSAADYILKNNLSRIAIISYDEDVAFFREKVQHAAIYSFGSRFDETEQAHLLFSLLRLADKENYEKIYAPLPGKSGVGLALFNRMIRAAAYTIVKV
jgi:L-threonylcarbamoyladenylate synthase